jgi:hypothetical protein
VQGTDGIWTVDTGSIHIEGRSPAHQWEAFAPYQDEYDAAAWSAIAPLSEASIAQGGHPVAFPDFTAGAWMHNLPIFVTDVAY